MTNNKTTTPGMAARELADAFETRKRDDGSQFVTLVNGTRETWIEHAVFKAHDGAFPNDSIFVMCEQAADIIADALDNDEADLDNLELHEAIGGAVPIYYYDIKSWFANNTNAQYAVDSAIADGFVDLSSGDIISVLQAGYYYQLEQIISGFVNAIREQCDAPND